MFKGNVFHGPDRLSVLMAFGSCYETQPLTPEFTVSMDDGKSTEIVRLSVWHLKYEIEDPDRYVLEGQVARDCQAPVPGHFHYRMSYNTARKTGHVTFFPFGEKASLAPPAPAR